MSQGAAGRPGAPRRGPRRSAGRPGAPEYRRLAAPGAQVLQAADRGAWPGAQVLRGADRGAWQGAQVLRSTGGSLRLAPRCSGTRTEVRARAARCSDTSAGAFGRAPRADRPRDPVLARASIDDRRARSHPHAPVRRHDLALPPDGPRDRRSAAMGSTRRPRIAGAIRRLLAGWLGLPSARLRRGGPGNGAPPCNRTLPQLHSPCARADMDAKSPSSRRGELRRGGGPPPVRRQSATWVANSKEN